MAGTVLLRRLKSCRTSVISADVPFANLDLRKSVAEGLLQNPDSNWRAEARVNLRLDLSET